MVGQRCVLVHLTSGIGNIVLATPLLAVLARSGFIVDLLITADYDGVTDLFAGWNAIRTIYSSTSEVVHWRSYDDLIAAIPPFYWHKYRSFYEKEALYRPPDGLFNQSEQAYYLQFAKALGCNTDDAPYYFLPSQYAHGAPLGAGSIVLAPGSKPNQMSVKRWPFYPELAARLKNVCVIGTENDLWRFDGSRLHFSENVTSFIGRLSLRKVAALLASAAVVVANDSGLGHMAGALGADTILIFGPTSNRSLGALPPNVTVLRSGLSCEPCWPRAPLRACGRRIDCLQSIDVDVLVRIIESRTGISGTS